MADDPEAQPQLYLQQRPARRRAAAGADRRAHAARRARGELLVPPPPRRLRVDPRAVGGPAGRRHGLRRGLRLRRAGARGARGRRRRRQPGGARARAAALHRPNACASRATSSRRSPSPPTPSSSCRRSSTCRTRTRSWSASRRWSPTAPAPLVFVSTPNVLTLAPEGAEKSGNPWHVKEYRPEEFRALCARALRDASRCTGCSTRASWRVHELAIKHARLGRRPRAARHHQAVLRLVHAGDLGQGLRADARTGRSTGALDFVAVCRP